MPQVHVTLAPGVREKIREKFGIESIDWMGEALVLLVEQFFKIEGRGDGAFTAITADSVKYEADIQVEVRYTAGEDEYGRGEPFDPSMDDQRALNLKIISAVYHMYGGEFTTSAWCKPHYKSVFVMEK